MRDPKEFCRKYNCTIAELAGLMGVAISTAQKWSMANYAVSDYHQEHIESLHSLFQILIKAETDAENLKNGLSTSKLQFYLNWRESISREDSR
jgi:hypothetical protein